MTFEHNTLPAPLPSYSSRYQENSTFFTVGGMLKLVKNYLNEVPGCGSIRLIKTDANIVKIYEQDSAGYGMTIFPLSEFAEEEAIFSPTPSLLCLNVVNALSGKKTNEGEWIRAMQEWISATESISAIAQVTKHLADSNELKFALMFDDENVLTEISLYEEGDEHFSNVEIVQEEDFDFINQTILLVSLRRFPHGLEYFRLGDL